MYDRYGLPKVVLSDNSTQFLQKKSVNYYDFN